MVPLFEILLDYQTQKMYFFLPNVEKKGFLRTLLHMRNKTLKSPYFKSLKE